MKARTFNWPLKYFWQMAILIIALLLAFGLRVYRLDHQSLRGDEAISAVYSAMPLTEMIAVTLADEPHPPLFYLILHAWERLIGLNDFMLRFWAVIPGFLAIPLLFALVKQVVGRKTGIAAAFLLAINSFHIWHSQDARSYTLLFLLGILSSLFLWQGLKSENRLPWLGYLLTVISLFYLHYYALFIVVFHGLFVLWLVLQKGISLRFVTLRWGGAMLITGLALFPWLLFHWQYVAQYKGNFSAESPQSILWRGLQAFSGATVFNLPALSLPNGPQYSVWATLIILLAALGAWYLWQDRKTAAIFFLLYLGVTFIGISFLSLRGNAFTERYLIAAQPAFLTFLASGLLGVKRWRFPYGLALTIIGFMLIIGVNANAYALYQFDESLAKSPPWREVLNDVAKRSKPGDALIFTMPLPTITYYNADRLPAHLVPYSIETTSAEAAADLGVFLERYNRLWLLPTKGLTPVADQVKPWLDKYAIRTDQTFFRILHTNLYETPRYFLSAVTPQPVMLADNIQLDGFRLGDGKPSLEPIKPGEAVRLILVWRADAPIDTPYTVFAHLVGPDGSLYGQWDNPPGRGNYPTTEWPVDEPIFDPYQIPVQESAPPGEYRLFVGMYNPTTGERLSVLDELGNPIADRVVLLTHLIVE